ncbi:MAG TPA: glycoside hydrolase family 15 protein, partial [Gemmataceae bacterium]|nr:glycoside hydrolase family 15 protein [Gemmataceae bacterium]
GCSCGYVGQSDGWTDLRPDHRMDWQFDNAPDGNVALTGELELRHTRDFVLVLAFGRSLHNVLVNVTQSRAIPFARHRERFVSAWRGAWASAGPAEEKLTGDGGSLYRVSRNLILAHEDKFYPGAIIASLSIPWGEAVTDVRMAGGYHLVWTRDMCQAATALLAAGDPRTPLRALTYLACAQRPDGGFYQNFWIDGSPYWHGVQLDETAYPVLLAHRLWRHGGLEDFDPYPLVRAAAKYLIEQGPVTPEDRWEENGGFSASTLAVVIAALVAAASFARDRDEAATAQYLLEYADFLVRHLEGWCVTTEGDLVPGVRRHFIRLNPSCTTDVHPDRDPNRTVLPIRNRPPGARYEFPAKDVVSTGFLELVRFGVLRPDDPLVGDTLRVVDAVLKVETPLGPCWHRYNHDGYGQREDGGPFELWGKGRAWPLLTGERGHYELAAGRDPGPFLRALEAFATPTRLLAEQVWDEADRPEVGMYFGRPTGGAMPLLWAHAEYIKLVRSAADGRVFDRVDEVADRYRKGPPPGPEVWKFNRQVERVPAGRTLRVQASAPFRLHWTNDEWAHAQDTDSMGTEVGIEFVDLTVPKGQKAPLRFTFFWKEAGHWEGTNFEVGIGEE